MLDIEGFRKAGYAAIDAVADYYASLQDRDVVSSVEPGYLEKEHITDDLPPVEGESWDVIAADFHKAILPGITHWQSPKFTAYFPANASFESIIADIYSGAVSNPGFNWSCSPACTELESKVMDWAGKMFGLDAGGFLGNTGIGGGCIMGSASEACLTIAVGARERALLTLHQQELAAAGLPETETSEIPPDVRERLSQRLVMYGSTQTHSIGAKAASILGHRFRALEVTQADDLSLRGETLRLALEEDTAKGLIPFMLVGTVGTTSSGAVDAIGELGRVVRDYPTVHFHVDAAWAGISYACPELREKGRLAECNEFASSFSTNAHKWGLTNFDCTGVWVKDRTLLTNALSLTPEFLRTKHGDTGAVIDYRNWNLALGRRFRSLKLWFVLRSAGISGFQAHIRNSIGLVDRLAEVITADADFALASKPSLALLTFRLAPASSPEASFDALTRKLHERLSARKDVLLTQTVLPEIGFCIRVAVGTPSTRWEHIEQIWAAIKVEAAVVLAQAQN